MKTKEIESLESYFKTENEYRNGFVFQMLCEVIKQGLFENPGLPLKSFDIAMDIFTEQDKNPLKAVQLFNCELDKYKLSPYQKFFVYEWVCKYLRQSEFDGMDLNPIKDLLNSQKDKLKAENQPLKPLTKNIREILKDLMQNELEQLPETLKGLEPKERLNVLCKLMPYVLPKVESVSHEAGEPDEFVIKQYW